MLIGSVKTVEQHDLAVRIAQDNAAGQKIVDKINVKQSKTADLSTRVIGIVAQADLALKDKPERVHKIVAEISKTTRPSIVAA